MTRTNVNDARCEALFASGLQPSDDPTAAEVAEVISRTVRQLGIRGCAGRMAQEFGDHPDAAVDRMRWARRLIGEACAGPARPPVGPRGAPHDARLPARVRAGTAGMAALPPGRAQPVCCS